MTAIKTLIDLDTRRYLRLATEALNEVDPTGSRTEQNPSCALLKAEVRYVLEIKCREYLAGTNKEVDEFMIDTVVQDAQRFLYQNAVRATSNMYVLEEERLDAVQELYETYLIALIKLS